MVQIMTWRRPGDKPLSKPMMVSLPTYICVTRLQWVNWLDASETGWQCLQFLSPIFVDLFLFTHDENTKSVHYWSFHHFHCEILHTEGQLWKVAQIVGLRIGYEWVVSVRQYSIFEYIVQSYINSSLFGHVGSAADVAKPRVAPSAIEVGVLYGASPCDGMIALRVTRGKSVYVNGSRSAISCIHKQQHKVF